MNQSVWPVGTGPLAESFPYIRIDKTGRYLLGASYGGHLVSVNPVGTDGKVSAPTQVIPTARNAHSIITDQTNRYVFVPHLGTDQVFQFRLDQQTGMLTANTPPLVQMKAGISVSLAGRGDVPSGIGAGPTVIPDARQRDPESMLSWWLWIPGSLAFARAPE